VSRRAGPEGAIGGVTPARRLVFFSGETAFSSFAADGRVNQAYTDAGALFVLRVALAPMLVVFRGREAWED